MSLMIHGGLQLTTVHGLLVIGRGSAWQTRCAMVQLGLTCWFTFGISSMKPWWWTMESSLAVSFRQLGNYNLTETEITCLQENYKSMVWLALV